jgi:hypothetical protein
MKSPGNTGRYGLYHTSYAKAIWLLIICFIIWETKAQNTDLSEDLLAGGGLEDDIQQSNFYNFSFDGAILTTDFNGPYHSPKFIGIPSDQIQACGDPLPAWPVVIAKFRDEDLSVTPSERISFMPCGGKVITRIWTVTDPSGNKSSKQQLITFSDLEPPLLTIAVDTMVGLQEEVPMPYYEASDHGCSSFTVDIAEEKVTLNESGYSIVRRYKATDGCGNSTSRTQQILVTGSEENDKQTKKKSVSALEFRK